MPENHFFNDFHRYLFPHQRLYLLQPFFSRFAGAPAGQFC